MKFFLVFFSIIFCLVYADENNHSLDATIKTQTTKNRFALIKTSKGDIVIELFTDIAPKTVENFLGLAEGKIEYTDSKTGKKKKGNFYDGLVFHRCIEDFMIQGGDPKADGSGGPGYRFNDEINGFLFGLDKEILEIKPEYMQQLVFKKTCSDLKVYSEEDYNNLEKSVFTKKFGENSALLREKMKTGMTKLELNQFIGYAYDKSLNSKKLIKGSVAMANAGPNTNGSQFFINVVDTPHLDGLHTNFGQVLKGIETATAISKLGVPPKGIPSEKVEILSIREITQAQKDELLVAK